MLCIYLDILAHDYNPGTQNAQAEGTNVQGQPHLYSEVLGQFGNMARPYLKQTTPKNKLQTLISKLITQVFPNTHDHLSTLLYKLFIFFSTCPVPSLSLPLPLPFSLIHPGQCLVVFILREESWVKKPI